MPSLTEMLRTMLSTQADSLQFRPGQPPLLFIKGESRPLAGAPLTPPELSALMDQVVDADQLAGLVARGKVDGSYAEPGLGPFHYRVRRLPEGMALAFRFDPKSKPPPEKSPPIDARPAVPPSAPPPARGPRPIISPPDRAHGRPASSVSPPAHSSAHSGSHARPGSVAPPRGAHSGAHSRPASPAPRSGHSGTHVVPGSVSGGPDWVGRFRQARTVHDLLRLMVIEQASDLLLSTGREARVRKIGGYRAIPGRTYRERDILESVSEVMTPARKTRLDDTGSVDLGFELPGDGTDRYRFRINIFRSVSGLAAAFRPIWSEIPTLDSLHLPSQIAALADFPHGLVLVCGPTGSGKSTTLSALIDRVNSTQRKHILTLEDPVEYIFEDKESLVHQREVGAHVDSFAAGLRDALREAPDVILVGEMRDLETIAAAITAAETGHLVLSTMHSGSASQAIDRIVDVFPEHQQQQVRMQLSDVLQAMIIQRLVPTKEGRSRVPIVEIVRVNNAISNMIRERRTHHFGTAIQSGRKEGMLPFDNSVVDLVRNGLLTREAGLRAARDPKHVTALLDG